MIAIENICIGGSKMVRIIGQIIDWCVPLGLPPVSEILYPPLLCLTVHFEITHILLIRLLFSSFEGSKRRRSTQRAASRGWQIVRQVRHGVSFLVLQKKSVFPLKQDPSPAQDQLPSLSPSPMLLAY